MAISEQEQESLGKRVCEWWKSMPNHHFKIEMPNDHTVTYSLFFTKRTIVLHKTYSSDYYSRPEMKTRYLRAFYSFLACLLISPNLSKWIIYNHSELDSLLSCSFEELEVKLDLKGF